jgi:hypothetical protein
MAFIIKVKRPIVRMFIGRVKKIKIGRKNAFRMPRIAAADKALKKPLTCIPLITYEVNVIDAVSISHLITIPFMSVSSDFSPFLIEPLPF